MNTQRHRLRCTPLFVLLVLLTALLARRVLLRHVLRHILRSLRFAGLRLTRFPLVRGVDRAARILSLLIRLLALLVGLRLSVLLALLSLLFVRFVSHEYHSLINIDPKHRIAQIYASLGLGARQSISKPAS